MAATKTIGRKHPVKHSKGPVRVVANTRSSVTAASAKNTGGIVVTRGVRTVPNARVSGLATSRSTNVSRASQGRGVRSDVIKSTKTL